MSAASPPLRFCPLCGLQTDAIQCATDRVQTLVPTEAGESLAVFRAGDLIAARYRVERLLGRGGFGAVYACEHVGTGHQVALKVLALDCASGNEEVRRFFQEARITSRLHHPNTVQLHDFGQAENGAIYMALELVNGPTLERRLRDRQPVGGAMSESETLQLAIGVLRSLAEAHSMGLVHRDLKPANIMYATINGEDEVVKVLDFGIARLEGSSLTMVGKVLGTPAYMSPEQCRGSNVDGRSDLYALGIVMFRCVTGAVPFSDSNPLVVLRKHEVERVPDLRALARVPLTDAFADCVYQALSKSPDDRPIDARTMRLALEGVLGGAWGGTPQPVASSQLSAAMTATRVAAAASTETGLAGSETAEETRFVDGLDTPTPARSPSVPARAAASTPAAVRNSPAMAPPKPESVVMRPVLPQPTAAVGAAPASGTLVFDPSAPGAPQMPKGPPQAMPSRALVPPPVTYPVAPPPQLAPAVAHTSSQELQAPQRSVPVAIAIGAGVGFLVVAAFALGLMRHSGETGGTDTIAPSKKAEPIQAEAKDGPVEPPPAPVLAPPPAPVLTPPSAPPLAADLNPWVAIEPANMAHETVLGVSKKNLQQAGFRPERKVLVPAKSYQLQQHEVTWAELAAWDPGHKRPDIRWPQDQTSAAVPATGLRWETAMAYCESRGGSLPTEAQWEYAAAGPLLLPNPWGEQRVDPTLTNALRPAPKLVAVKTSRQDHRETATGGTLYDLAGNAQEWMLDLWREDAPDQDESWVSGADGTAYRAVRGLPPEARPEAQGVLQSVAYRESMCAAGPCVAKASELMQWIGFRCVRER